MDATIAQIWSLKMVPTEEDWEPPSDMAIITGISLATIVEPLLGQPLWIQTNGYGSIDLWYVLPVIRLSYSSTDDDWRLFTGDDISIRIDRFNVAMVVRNQLDRRDNMRRPIMKANAMATMDQNRAG